MMKTKILCPLIVFVALAVSNALSANPFQMIDKKDLTALEAYVKKGGDLTVRNNYGSTPLLYAIYAKQAGAVKMLLNAGADPNQKSTGSYEATAVQAALYTGQSDIFRLLIEKGAKPDGAMYDGQTSLHLAARYGDTTVVEWLLKKGFDVNLFATGSHMSDGLAPLHYAAARRKSERW